MKKEGRVILNSMEENFNDLIRGNGNDPSAIRSIEKKIETLFGIHIKLAVVPNKTGQFYGMSVFPQQNVMDELIDNLIKGDPRTKETDSSKLWFSNKNWIVEIDSMLFDNMKMSVTPKEMVAILLHELGHVAFSNKVVTRIIRALEFEYTKVSFRARSIMRWPRARRIFDFVAIQAASAKNYMSYKSSLKEEMEADYYAYELGYGEALEDFIQKLLETYGNEMINRREKDIQKDVNSVAIWSLENISELEFRKTKLQRTLEKELRTTPSAYTRMVVHSIKDKFFARDTEDLFQSIAQENAIGRELKYYESVLEQASHMLDKSNRVKQLRDIDLEILRSEISRIRTMDDKMFVLSKLQDMQDIIDFQKECIDNKENVGYKATMPENKIYDFEKRLDQLLEAVSKIKIKSYRGFIKLYPSGYEG